MSKISKEELQLLEQFSRNSASSSAHIIYGNALLVSIAPLWYYWRIQELDLMANMPIFAVISILTAFCISLAYKNTKSNLIDRIASKRSPIIAKQLKENKKYNKKEAEDLIRHTTKDVSEYESSTFTIFYINALFIMFFVLSSSFFHQIPAHANLVICMLASSGLTVLLTQSKASKTHKS